MISGLYLDQKLELGGGGGTIYEQKCVDVFNIV